MNRDGSRILRFTRTSVVAALLAAAVAAHGAQGDCAQPLSNGNGPVASDCLYVLKAGVGSVECELCVCDTNASTTVTASDALLCLRDAVGQIVTLDCEPCAEPVTLTVKNYLGWCQVSVDGGSSTTQSTQTIEVPAGSVVTVHAEPGSGFEWAYWYGTDGDLGGPPHDTAKTTAVTMNADRTVQACCRFSGGGDCPAP